MTVQVQRHRGMTEQAAVHQACRMLRLPAIRSQFGELAEGAAREQMSYLGFLAECDDRGRRRSERRIKAAAFPREKSLRTGTDSYRLAQTRARAEQHIRG